MSAQTNLPLFVFVVEINTVDPRSVNAHDNGV